MKRQRGTNTKRFTLVNRYGVHFFQYVTCDQLTAKGQVAVLSIWDEGGCSGRKCVNKRHVPANDARKHAKEQLGKGMFWKHEVDTARHLVFALRRAAGTEELSYDRMVGLGMLY